MTVSQLMQALSQKSPNAIVRIDDGNREVLTVNTKDDSDTRYGGGIYVELVTD